ncbi:hypothetical protein ABPG77_006618 [Micractinium sp. CCAP 211/92]
MKLGEDNACPTFRPTRAAFERPFCEYVSAIFKKHPDLACFKVVPPKGWAPRRRAPDLSKIRINTPIKQHVFGKSGSYVCILEEQRGMTAAEFKRISERPDHQPPSKGHRGASDSQDEVNERAFWSGLTNNPPLYGADTPVSLFDEKLPFGWNLRRLGCMLQDPRFDVPTIPGVTSPMTYFGMWKSFFGWHKEDIDLFSINYLHFGAPKIWYCVSPRDNPKFEAMAQALYPDLYRSCQGFMRHKDIMISPKVLRQYNVPYLTAKQEAGEFIVLNAAAFHAGFNCGFNCAEAVNFAMEEWLDVGCAAVPCTCSCLPDGVALDMGIFLPELRESSSDEEEEDSEEEEEERPTTRRRTAAGAAPGHRRGGPTGRGRGRRAAASPADRKGSEEETEEGSEEEGEDVEDSKPARPAPKQPRGAAGALKPMPVRPATRVPDVIKATWARRVPRTAGTPEWGKLAEDRPLAVVERDEQTRQLKFSLCHRLDRTSSKPGAMWVGVLREGTDGLFRPQGAPKLLQLGVQYPRVVRVRAEWQPPQGRKQAGGWALKTKRERILMDV